VVARLLHTGGQVAHGVLHHPHLLALQGGLARQLLHPAGQVCQGGVHLLLVAPAQHFYDKQAVLRIRDVYPGSRISDPGSRISDPGSKNSNKREG
jgi:hypothetical protein